MPAASTANAGTQTCTHDADRTGNEPFPKLTPIVLPMTRFGAPKPTFDDPAPTVSVTSCTPSTAVLQ